MQAKFNNIAFYIIGGTLSYAGVSILINPLFHSPKYGITYDLTGVNLPIGIALILFGAYIIIVIRLNAIKKNRIEIAIREKMENKLKEKSEKRKARKAMKREQQN